MGNFNDNSKGGVCICVRTDIPSCECGCDSGNSGGSPPGAGAFSGGKSFSSGLSSTRTDHSSESVNYDFGMGYNWTPSWPYVTGVDSENVMAVLPGRTMTFTYDYTRGYVGPDGYQLAFSRSANLFTLTTPAGVWEFVGFNDGTRPKGRLKSFAGSDGLQAVVTGYTAFAHIAGIEITHAAGGGSESYQYEYEVHADYVERLRRFTRSRLVEGGERDALERFEYTYHATGDLKTMTKQVPVDGQWINMGVEYYRYFSDGEQGGAGHLLKYAVEPEHFEALAADPEVSDPFAAPDDKVAQYASQKYTYNANYQVATTQRLDDSGSTFQYIEGDANTTDPNVYRRGIIETRADGSVRTRYVNSQGQTLLEEFKENATTQERTLEYRQYDSNGNLILHATPGALEGYEAQYYSIVPIYRSEGGVYNVGLIHVYEYYAETSTHQGGVGVKGSRKCDKIKQGRDGTAILLRQYEYTEHSAVVPTGSGSSVEVTTYPIAREIRYRNDNGTGQIVTSYSYTWHPGSIKMATRVTTHPAVAVEQNGSGVSATRVERFDTSGNLIWVKDERGYLTHHQYDTRARLLTTIQDVDDALAAVPDGWSTPAEGGQHLVTDYEYDSLGRVTQVLGPEHEAVIDDEALTVRTATWTVYKDATRETWTAQGYAIATGFTSSNEPCFDSWLVNPVSITKSDIAGRTRESIQAVRTSREGKLSASDSFIQSSYVRWTTNQYDLLGRLISTRAYHTIPTTGDGERGTHYDQTDYGYDAMGRQNRHKSPGGTITRTVYNPQGQPIAVYVGTDDTGATDADPTGGSTGTNNMVLVTEYEYNASSGCSSCGGGGQGQLAALIQHVDAQDFRVTNYHYDWRSRQEYVVLDEDAEGRVTYTKSYYDNLDRVVKVERYWQRGGAFSSSSWDEDLLLGRTAAFYDNRGQVYQTRVYATDDLGEVGNYLEGNTWYDEAGNPIKQQTAGTKGFTKIVCDSLGRAVKQYIGHDTDETTYSEAASVSDDTILEQTETAYNEVGSVLFVTTRRRMHNATGAGELNGPSGAQPKARTSYTASWYDGIGRPIASANYGTGGGTAPARPPLPPERSDEVLVTSTQYNDGGEAFAVIDPAGREDRREFDALGRVLRTIQNYHDGLVDGQHPDEDITLEKSFGPDGQVLTLVAKNPTTGDQVTRYVYGTTLADSSVARTDLLRAAIYPDSDDTGDPLDNGTDGVYDRIEYTYNRQGERITKKDQNETVHAYDYDNLGRRIEDRVTAVGSGVDDQVRRIAARYTVRGQVERVASYDDPVVGSGTVLNEVQFVYNAFGQLVADYQEHSGTVDMATTPRVAYVYTDGSSGHIRRTQLAYPNDRVLRYEYTAGTDEAFNRVSFLAEDARGVVGDHLAEHSYLGTDQFIRIDYPEPSVRYDLAHGVDDDPYDGLDRFDRVIDLVWRDQTLGVDVERVMHGYDRAGNRLWRETPVAAAHGVNLDELYVYDGVNQLVAFARGDLNAAKNGLVAGTRSLAQDWLLDATGNWSNFQEDTNGDGALELDQSRTHDQANETTQLASISDQVAHDSAGNMTRIPKPDNWAAHYDLTYDAWNRVATVRDGSVFLAQFSYDATGRRIEQLTDFIDGEPQKATHFFCSDQQVIEIREGSTTASPVALSPKYQNVWSPRYIDSLVLRDEYSSGVFHPDSRLYYLADANHNVTVLIRGDGQIRERYIYSAYGKATIYTPDWSSTRTSSLHNNTTLYTGRLLDSATSLYYYRARYFSADLGRFISRDPIGYADGANLYPYTRNMPTYFVDPYGYFPIPDCLEVNYRPAGFSVPGLPRNNRTSAGIGFLSASFTVEIETPSATLCKRCCGPKTKNAGKIVNDFMVGVAAAYNFELSASTWGGTVDFSGLEGRVWLGLRGSIGAYGRAQARLESNYCDNIPWEFKTCFNVNPYGQLSAGGEASFSMWGWYTATVGVTGNVRVRVAFEICMKCREGVGCTFTGLENKGAAMDIYLKACLPIIGCVRGGLSYNL